MTSKAVQQLLIIGRPVLMFAYVAALFAVALMPWAAAVTMGNLAVTIMVTIGFGLFTTALLVVLTGSILNARRQWRKQFREQERRQ